MRPRRYLDHAATSWPKAPGVDAALLRFLAEEGGNPGRGGHSLAVAALRRREGARAAVAELLGGDPERCLLGPGATHWLNVLLQGLLSPGDRVVCSSLEHNAVMRPLAALAAARGVEIVRLAGEALDGVPSPAELRRALAAGPTRLVVFPHASNVSGALLPIAELCAAAGETPLIVDAAQSAGAVPIDFAASGAAALVCSGHKGLLGPPGTGVLLLRPGFAPPPLLFGGTGSRSESEAMPRELPDRLEAGSPNALGDAGLEAAVRWLAQRGVAELHAQALALANHALAGLREVSGVTVLGLRPDVPRMPTFTFRLAGWDQGELALWLDREWGLLLRAGLHCAPAAHRRLGSFPEGGLRASFGPFNTHADADTLVTALQAAAALRPAAQEARP